MGRGKEYLRRKLHTAKQWLLGPETASVPAAHAEFPMAGIRYEYNSWKGQFTLQVKSDTLSQYETHRTSEIVNTSYHLRLLTNIIAKRVRQDPETASYESFAVEFYREGAPQPCSYVMTHEPRLVTVVLDGSFYQLGSELQIAPDGDSTQLRYLQTNELKSLQARMDEIVEHSDSIRVSEYHVSQE